MTSTRLETFLARLLVDREFRQDFLRDPQFAMDCQELDRDERNAVLKIDREDLALAARSIAAKRTATGRGPSGHRTWWKRLARQRADPRNL